MKIEVTSGPNYVSIEDLVPGEVYIVDNEFRTVVFVAYPFGQINVKKVIKLDTGLIIDYPSDTRFIHQPNAKVVL